MCLFCDVYGGDLQRLNYAWHILRTSPQVWFLFFPPYFSICSERRKRRISRSDIFKHVCLLLLILLYFSNRNVIVWFLCCKSVQKKQEIFDGNVIRNHKIINYNSLEFCIFRLSRNCGCYSKADINEEINRLKIWISIPESHGKEISSLFFSVFIFRRIYFSTP